jgi:hypothetical protein
VGAGFADPETRGDLGEGGVLAQVHQGHHSPLGAAERAALLRKRGVITPLGDRCGVNWAICVSHYLHHRAMRMKFRGRGPSQVVPASASGQHRFCSSNWEETERRYEMRKNTMGAVSTLAAVAFLAGSASAASAFDEPSDDRPIVIHNDNTNTNNNTNNNTNTNTLTNTLTVSNQIDIGL